MDREYLKLKLNNLVNIRNIYAAVIIALTGYLFSMFMHVSKLILFCTAFIDFIFIMNYISINSKIDRILKIIRGK